MYENIDGAATCPTSSLTITEAQLLQMMGNDCNNCASNVAQLNVALQEADMNCMERALPLISIATKQSDHFRYMHHPFPRTMLKGTPLLMD